MQKTLKILYNDMLIGNILYEEDKLSFKYDKDWITSSRAFPLSFHIPLEDTVYKDSVVYNFFKGLLPEGNVLLSISKKKHVSEDNLIGMLSLLGGECAGAISIANDLPLGHLKVKNKVLGIKDDDEMSLDDLDAMIDRMGQAPLLTDRNDYRISLAGIQQKTAVNIRGGKAYFPSKTFPSTYIIKPDSFQFNSSSLNEYTCMKIASKIGINVSNVQLILTKNHVSFMTMRFDRILNSKSEVRKIHQIDLNQAANISPNMKYETEGGASYKDLFNVMDSNNISGKEDIVKWAAFNFLISNNDAHSKNIAFLLRCKGKHKLAPHFDMLCTGIYPDLSKDMSMSIGGEFSPENVCASSWSKFAKEINIEHSKVIDIIENTNKLFSKNYSNIIQAIKKYYSEDIDCEILDDMEDIFNYKSQLLSNSTKEEPSFHSCKKQ